MGFCLLENHGDIQDIVHACDGLIGVHGAAIVLRLYGDDQSAVLCSGVNLHAGNMRELCAYRGIRARSGVKDALNNSFPGVLRLGYFSDGANLS